MSEFSKRMDRSGIDVLLGEMLGAIAELEAEGHETLYVADAAVLAAIRKVQRTQPPVVAQAWATRVGALFTERVQLGEELATEAGARGKMHRLN